MDPITWGNVPSVPEFPCPRVSLIYLPDEQNSFTSLIHGRPSTAVRHLFPNPFCYHLPMADWLDSISKIVTCGALGSFVTWLGFRSHRKRMREQLYREISNNYQGTVVRIAVVLSHEGMKRAAAMNFNDKLRLSFDTWNHYNDEKRREMLFDLKEAGAISRIYGLFSAIGNEELSGYAHVRGKEAAAEVDDCLLDGTLDRKLYQKVSKPEAWKYMQKLLDGTRPSYRKELSPF